MPAAILAPKPPVSEVRASGVARASNSPTITLAPLTGSPVDPLTTRPTSSPLRESAAWSKPGVGLVSSPVALDAEAPAPRCANTVQIVSVLSPW